MVLISLSSSLSEPRSRKKSTRAMPAASTASKAARATRRISSAVSSGTSAGPQKRAPRRPPGGGRGLEGGAGHAAYLFCGLVRYLCRDAELHAALDVLGVVVVEAVALQKDLAGYGDFRVLVAKDRDLYLPRVNAPLDDDAPVELRRRVEGGAQPLGVLSLPDADAGAEVSRLDEARVAQGVFDLPHPCLRIFPPLLAGEAYPLDLGEPVVGEDLFHGDLVHPDGAAEDPAADVGHAGQLEHALDGPVLAVGPVQDGEDDVHGAEARRKLLPGDGRGAGG